MGRRPNPLMAEFFERGAKISDMSNRYEQRCKRCNEVFPKGRNEAMVPHLTRKCPGISHKERAKIIFRMHDLALPDLNPYIDPNYVPETDTAGTQTGVGNNHQSQNGRTTVSQNQTRVPDFDGLNVLAEASRRVGRNERDTDHSYRPANEDGDVLLDPQLEANSFQHATAATLPITTAASSQDATAPTYPENYSYLSDFAADPQDHLAVLPLAGTDATYFSAMTATAHEALGSGAMADPSMPTDRSHELQEELQEHDFPMEGAGSVPWPTGSSTQPLDQSIVANQTNQTNNTLAELFRSAQATAIVPMALRAPPSKRSRPVATNTTRQPASASAESNTRPQRPKQRNRGKFAPERRTEVREVRKLGACLRCRLLRKPCSQGTPCQTCAPIQNPRLYKIACMRTKIEEELPHYSAIPYTVLANHDLENLKGQGTFAGLAGVLEASHLPGHKMVFKARQVTMHASFNPADFGGQPFQESEVIVLDIGSDNVLPKIEQYLQAITSEIIDTEPSPAMKPSLQIAQALQEQKKQSTVPPTKTESLIGEVIELWVATVLMTDNHLRPIFTIATGTEDEAAPADKNMNITSEWMLATQFRAAIENRASIVCKNVLHHFSQRVVQRNYGGNFETFLIAFIMLNCAERMQWLYRSWGLPNAHFPLDSDPTTYVDQAESFAGMVLQLLEVRKMEPKIEVDSSTGSLVARNNDETALANWLTLANFTSDLTTHFGSGQFNPADSRSLDGTFSARVFHF